MIQEAQFQNLAESFPVVGVLPAAAREEMMRSAVPFRLPAGAVAFDTYAACESFPMLTQGRIRVGMPAPNGREILLYRVEPGQTCVLTLNCLLSDSEYGARGIAARDCEGYGLPRDLFLKLIDDHEEFRGFVFQTLSRRVLDLMALIEEVAFKKLDQRLASLLLHTTRGDVVEKTHQQMADELGSVREIVSRILGGFADEGLVEVRRGRVLLLDTNGLQKVSEGE